MDRRTGWSLATALMLSLLLSVISPLTSLALAAPAEADSAPLEILPQMELLAGVLSQTTWGRDYGPQGKGSEYYQALKAFMEPYQDHMAVLLAQDLIDRGFTYDAPPCFACHLGPLPDLELVAEYSDYLAERAGDRTTLEGFRVALKDLAGDSSFLEFFDDWDETLQKCVERSSAGFDQPKIEKWLTEFFGWAADEFHVVLAPSLYPGGGYGATVVDRDRRSISYEIVPCQGRSEGKPDLPSGRSLEILTLHEFGHYFVNPVLEKHESEEQALQPWYAQVRSRMDQRAYRSLHIYAVEQVLRAACAVAQKDLYGEGTYEDYIGYEERNGFYLTRLTAEALSDYARNRDKYPKFTDFAPELLRRMSAEDPPVGPATEAQGTLRRWVTFAWNTVALRWSVAFLIVSLILWRLERTRKESQGPKAE